VPKLQSPCVLNLLCVIEIDTGADVPLMYVVQNIEHEFNTKKMSTSDNGKYKVNVAYVEIVEIQRNI